MRKILILILCLSFMLLPASAEEPPKYVALTFDDGPAGRFTRNLLDGLELRGVKATFFLCGYRMEQYPELVLRIADEGHEIGIHGFTHSCMGTMCRKNLEEELARCLKLLPPGCSPTFLRPPGGKIGNQVIEIAKESGFALLGWSVDPRDWATNRAGAVQSAVVRDIRDGDVVLLHDMSDSSVAAALGIIDALQAKGFVFVTASELASRRGIQPEPGRQYHKFP